MDLEISLLLQKELERQQNGLELIASENFVSSQVMQAMGNVLTNKYAEGYPGKRYYAGCEFVDEIENIANDRIKKLFGAEYANVQPHSGAQANASIFLACLKPGDTVLGFDLSHGGHLSHGSSVNFSGKIYNAKFYGVQKESGLIDMDNVEKIALEVKPKLIVCGASAYSRDWDYKKFREIADLVGAILLADISHPAGLIAKKKLNDPIPHCHIISSTTHKTLRGPRGGIILMGKDIPTPWGAKTSKNKDIMLSTALNSGVFPGMQGGPLMHIIASKAIAFGEALSPEFESYATQVILNAQAMSKSLVAKGYNIVSGGTENHLMLIDLRNKNISGKAAEKALTDAEITTNKNMVPFDDQSPSITSGIRLGSAAITSRGLKENDCLQIIEWIDEVIKNADNSEKKSMIKLQVHQFMSRFPLYSSI